MSRSRKTAWLSSIYAGLLVAGGTPLLAHGPNPTGVVKAFHEALASGDREAALELLLPQALVFESGRSETVEQYSAHHLAADMAFATATSHEIVEQNDQTVEDVAWVMTRSRRRGDFKDKEIDSTTVETVVLHHVKAGWRIAHIHWSSAKTP